MYSVIKVIQMSYKGWSNIRSQRKDISLGLYEAPWTESLLMFRFVAEQLNTRLNVRHRGSGGGVWWVSWSKFSIFKYLDSLIFQLFMHKSSKPQLVSSCDLCCTERSECISVLDNNSDACTCLLFTGRWKVRSLIITHRGCNPVLWLMLVCWDRCFLWVIQWP